MSTTIEAPRGAVFEYGEVKTGRGATSLGDVPILIWNDLDGAREHYTDEGINRILNGTSLKVAFQAIGRRMKIAGKTDDEIAKAQVDYKPGERQVGQATPSSRARRAAGSAAEKLADPDLLTALLAKITSGELDEDTLATLVG